MKLFSRLYAFTFLILAAHAYLFPAPTYARVRGTTAVVSSTGPYDNACGSVPAGQNWCVENALANANYGWTTFTPLTTANSCGSSCTGTCSAGTYTGTCVTYIAEQGTGTLTTCRIAAPSNFSFTTDPTNGGANMSAACPYQETYMSGPRTGTADYLLFRRGDCFVDPGQISPCLGTANAYTTSWGICVAHGVTCNYSRNGLDANNFMVIGAFGPTANARPFFVTINACLASQSTSGNYLAAIDIACDTAKPRDFKNPVYNPGVFTAASSSGAGATTITLNSAPSTQILQALAVSGGGWCIYNFSNPTEMAAAGGCGGSFNTTGMKITGVSGAVITLQGTLTAGFAVNSGDRLVFQPLTTASSFTFNGQNLTTYYIEGTYSEGSAIGHNITGLVSSSWPNGNLLHAYVRRNVVFQSASVATRNQGGFFGDTFNPNSTLLVEENVFDHTGWRQVDGDCTVGQFLPAKCNGVASEQYENFYGNPNNQSQNSYDHENCCVATFRRNLLTNGSGAGIQVRSGGTNYNNFYSRNGSASTGGGIVTANDVTYNVQSDLGNSYCAVLQVRGVSGNTLTFDYFPQSALAAAGCPLAFNASNPSGINQSSNNTYTATTTTVTIGGPAVSVSIGDWIYFLTNGPQWGLESESTMVNTLPAPGPNLAFASNVQWNVVTGNMPFTSGGGTGGGWGLATQSTTLRSTGNAYKNNYLMNLNNQGILDQAEITGVDGTGCSGNVRITLSRAGVSTPWQPGDSIVTTGIQPSSMNANVSTTVASVPTNTTLCLASSPFGTGTWTANTGVVNGGVDWGTGVSLNQVYNVTTPSSDARAATGSFTPVGTTICPQHAGCPSIEAYDLSIGGDGTLSHFLVGARANKRGSWSTAYTASVANNYIRAATSAGIPLPSH